MVLVILPDGRERSVPCAATDLAKYPSPEPMIHPPARISVRSLLPLANRLRIMLLCQVEDNGGGALPGRSPTHATGRGAGAKALGRSSGGGTTTAGAANGADDPAPSIDTEPYGGA